MSFLSDDDLRTFLSPRNRTKDGWGKWKRKNFANGNTLFENSLYVVSAAVRKFKAGTFTHLIIREKRASVSGEDHEPRWRAKQRIKNELFGDDAVAIELMPAQSEVLGQSDHYHIWIVPRGFKMPRLWALLQGQDGWTRAEVRLRNKIKQRAAAAPAKAV